MKTAVSSKSFSADPELVAELRRLYPEAKLNSDALDLSGSELVRFFAGCESIIIGVEKLTDPVLNELPDLKIVSKYGVGIDNLDLASLERRGIRLGWTPGVNRRAVSELALALMISTLRNVPELSLALQNGEWLRSPGRQLSERRVGVLGCGCVGKDLIRLLKPFGCVVSFYDRVVDSAFVRETGAQAVSLEELFEKSDIVSIHLPLTPSTRNLIGASLLSRMPKGAVLVNTARGGLVVESDVVRALDEGRLSRAAFDVFAEEPATKNMLAQHPRCLSVPHIGGSSQEAILAMGRAAIRGLSDHHPISYFREQGLIDA